MVKHNQTNKNSLMSRNYSLSFSQLAFFAVAFAAIGGVKVWRGLAAPAPTAQLIANPNPAAVGSNETFTGCGYYPNQGATVVIYSPYATSWFGSPADANGCIDSSKYDTFTNNQTGSYTVKVYQNAPKNPKRDKLMGSVIYTVQ